MKTLIIFLHGSGGTGHDLGKFLGINRYRSFEGKTFIQKAQENGISIITPTAPLQSYSPAFGEKVNVWFDRSPNFIELGRNDIEYDPRFSIQNINDIIKSQEGDFDRLYVGGFSMGGGLALHYTRLSVCPSDKLVGVFCMGSFLVSNSAVFQEDLRPNLQILSMHGVQDSLIDVNWGQDTAHDLHLRNPNVKFKKYIGLDHEIGEVQLKDLFDWIVQTQSSNLILSSPSSTTLTSPALECLDPSTGWITGIDVPISYKLKPKSLSGDSSTYTIELKISPDRFAEITERPVFACGGVFELKPSNHGVKVEASTTDPHNLAKEIGIRLVSRFDSTGTVDPCPMS